MKLFHVFKAPWRHAAAFCFSIAAFVGIFSIATVGQSDYNISREEALASLQTNRDRLLQGYAADNGYNSATAVWASLSPSQKGVFLTITDYLGRRLFMRFNDNYQIIYQGDEDDRAFGCEQMNEIGSDVRSSGAYIHPLNYYGPACFQVTAETCAAQGKCFYNMLPRTDHDMALNHVEKIYAVNGSNGNDCGGINYNRIFFRSDVEFLYFLRNIQLGLPGLDVSTDWMGPHSPFTQSRESIPGQPRAQTHQFAWDYEAVFMTRPGVQGVYDPRLVEIDLDYNTIHSSNPQCTYDGTQGRYFYQNFWYPYGLYGDAELGYVPSSTRLSTK